MLYKLLYEWRDFFSVLNVFQYITFRVALAAFTSFVLSLVLGPYVIRRLRRMRIGACILEDSKDVFEKHKDKAGTPNMGGILIIFSVLVSLLLWCDITNRNVLVVTFASMWLGIVGFVDDHLKNQRKSAKGLCAKHKFLAQVFLAILLCGYFYLFPQDQQLTLSIYFPFFKDLSLYLGVFYAVLIFCVMVGTSNAVNLTDGLDGLAVGCSVIAMAAYGLMSYIAGHAVFSEYLHIPFVAGSGELAVFCASVVGAGLGFLWFNCHPADVFMGDTGSLFLGGAMGIVALIIKQELLLIIIGGVFVMEALSVILQVSFFKWKKKRIFLVAPIHHHFESKGWQESRVIIRFWILALICAVMGLAALKLR